jgi:polygalacturonase
MTIDDSAGDSEGGHNTDGFDIGSSSNVVINGANVYNQDDCVAINSGTVCNSSNFKGSTDDGVSPLHSRMASAPGAMDCPSALLVVALITLSAMLPSRTTK